MALFDKECPHCGHKNSPQASFCAECGTPLGGGKVICGVCNTENRSDARYCKKCGRELAANAAPEVRAGRWARHENDFAVRIDSDDLPGIFRRGIVVEMGTNALLVENGVNRGMVPPGTYTLDSLDKHLLNWLSTGLTRTATVLLVDVMPAELEFHMGGIFTSDPINIGMSVRLNAQVDEPALFLVNMLGRRERMSRTDLMEYLNPEIAQLVEGWVRHHTVQELAEDLSLKEKLELALEEALKTTFAQTGLKFLNVRTLEMSMDHLDRIKGIKSKYALQVTETEAELQGKQRLLDVMKGMDLNTLAEETQKVENEEKRAELYHRMRQAVLNEKMDEIRSEAQFTQFLDEQDKQKLLSEKERGELLRTWKEEAEDHDLQRKFLLQKLEIEQNYQTEKVTLMSRADLDQTALDNEIALARKRSDFEFEQKRKVVEAEYFNERERDRIADERRKTQIEITALERQQERADDAADVKNGIEWLGLMKQMKRLDMEETLRIQRFDEIEREKARLEIELKRFEMEERRRQAEREHEIKRIQELAQFGSDALISLSGPEQAKVLAELRKNDYLKGMTEEQILAAAAKDSPEVARALQEKYRAMAEGTLSERERKLYEGLVSDHKVELDRVNEMWTRMADREKETSHHAMDRMADVAQSFARGQGNQPVIITTPGGGVIRTTGVSASEASGEDKTCPKCGRHVNVGVHFCPHCGHEFEDVK